MALFVPEEEIFPSEAITDQVLVDSIADNIIDVSRDFLPTPYEKLFQAMDDFELKG